MLRDLRALSESFREAQAFGRGGDSRPQMDFVSTVNEILVQCVDSLKTTLVFFMTAGKAATPQVRNGILERREQMIRSVQASARKLNSTFGELQGIGAAANHEAQLTRLGQELTQQLVIARRIDAKMKSLERSLGMDEVSRGSLE
jgi:hypothetical protein